jgi:hypothetical protein
MTRVPCPGWYRWSTVAAVYVVLTASFHLCISAIGKALPQRSVWNAAMAVMIDDGDEGGQCAVLVVVAGCKSPLSLSLSLIFDVAAALSLFLISSLFSPFSAFSQNADPSYEHASSCGLCSAYRCCVYENDAYRALLW